MSSQSKLQSTLNLTRVAFGAAALGAVAVGAAAFGAFAVGSLIIRRGRIDQLSIGSLTVDELTVNRLTIRDSPPVEDRLVPQDSPDHQDPPNLQNLPIQRIEMPVAPTPEKALTLVPVKRIPNPPPAPTSSPILAAILKSRSPTRIRVR